MNESRQTPSWNSPYRVVMALRLLRARKINLISIVGIMLGVASIIVVMAVMDGFQRDLRAMIRGTLSDLIIEVDPTRLDSYAALKSAVEAVDGVDAVALQKQTFGAIPIPMRGSDGGRQNYLPLRVVGILAKDEARVSSLLNEYLVEGAAFALPENVFAEEETPRVVISSWIARRLATPSFPLRPGEEFTLMWFEEAGEKEQAGYRAQSRKVIVSGVYDSKNSEYDRFHVYVDLEGTGHGFFPVDQGVITELRVRLTDYGRVEEMRESVARALAPFDPGIIDSPRAYIKTWEERQQNLLLAVDNEKVILAFVLFFIVLVACFTIFATLTMTVVEKTREIGVLRALGATPQGILSIFMINGTLVGVAGAALGYVVGLIVAGNVNPIRSFLKGNFGWDIFPSDIYVFDQIPSYVDHGTAFSYALLAAGWALLSAIVPAVRAARMRPVTALRFE